jgi:tetratricopeptide (TPR) repeat protein
VLLAEASDEKALALYRKGVEAGERALRKETFEIEAGHFWGLLETHPYMRARAGLAQSLWNCGRHDEAIAHWRDMLRLNPQDDQGIRYVLGARLLELSRDRDLAALLKQHDDGDANLTCTKALLSLRTNGNGNKPRRAHQEAVESNGHVATDFLDPKWLSRPLPEDVGFGDEDEAVRVVADSNPVAPTKSTLEPTMGMIKRLTKILRPSG